MSDGSSPSFRERDTENKLMLLVPSYIVHTILGIKTAALVFADADRSSGLRDEETVTDLPLGNLDSTDSYFQDMKSAITHQAKIRTAGHCKSRFKEGRECQVVMREFGCLYSKLRGMYTHYAFIKGSSMLSHCVRAELPDIGRHVR